MARLSSITGDGVSGGARGVEQHPAITDAQRDAWNVPSLAEAQAEAARLNAEMNATAGAPN